MTKFFYGLAFCVGLPFFLWLWATHSVINLPLALSEHVSLVIIFIGSILCLWSIISLMKLGKGLPMNAFPPTAFVTKGPYVLFAHPIYVGFCILIYGIAAYSRSSSGFYLVAPTVSLAATALAMGYENFDMKKRFAFLRYEPFVGLIHKDKNCPDYRDKIRFTFTLLLNVMFIAIHTIGQHHGTLSKKSLLILGLYMLAVIGSLKFIKSFQSLRKIGIQLFIVGIIIGLQGTMSMLIAGTCLALVMPYALCSIHDFIGKMANSWHAWHFGRIRIINHGFYVGSAALFAFIMWDILTPQKIIWPLFMLSLLGLVGAGIWGQILEGSGRLKRPFGYFGALLAGALGALVLFALDSTHIWIIYGALAIAFCFGQGFGRLRCLVNGCCHGALAPDWIGVYIWHPESRVSKISSLARKKIYPSQIFSALILLSSGSLLWWMWISNARLSLIVGMYLILSGIGRFIEEATRGEVQTKIIAGLRLYQWLALFMLIIGAFLTCIDSPFSSGTIDFGAIIDHAPFYIAIAVLYTMAFGIDFPSSERRFSKL